jgi:hypothetical protein
MGRKIVFKSLGELTYGLPDFAAQIVAVAGFYHKYSCDQICFLMNPPLLRNAIKSMKRSIYKHLFLQGTGEGAAVEALTNSLCA